MGIIPSFPSGQEMLHLHACGKVFRLICLAIGPPLSDDSRVISLFTCPLSFYQFPMQVTSFLLRYFCHPSLPAKYAPALAKLAFALHWSFVTPPPSPQPRDVFVIKLALTIVRQ
jgi:hypothetical protein